MYQQGAVFVPNTTYIRMKESGTIHCFNEEQERLVKKEQADFVRCTGIVDGEYRFEVVKMVAEEEAKPVSTPAKRPEIKPVAVTPTNVSVPVAVAQPTQDAPPAPSMPTGQPVFKVSTPKVDLTA